MDEQRCGTCYYFDDEGYCAVPLPLWVLEGVPLVVYSCEPKLTADYGVNCETWRQSEHD